MANLNYARVKGYWNAARPSILGPYMMDGFGFPASAGQFRFCAECKIVQRLIQGTNHDGAVLDLGSGVGHWTEYFAQHFARVVAVEGSRPLYEALEERCALYLNAESILGDVMSFEPEDRYELVFLGGLLMYLNERDVIRLLCKLVPSLRPAGVIVCRETTVRQGVVTREGDYQAVYRSVVAYRRIFGQSGLSLSRVELNVPYVQLQMGCEVIKRWKAIVPKLLQLLFTTTVSY